MTIIEAASVNVKTLADGTLRVSMDVEPRHAQAAFALFGAPGTPMALAALKKSYNVDERRIYATGFSNGAHFTYLLWATRPNVFAAFAPVAGRIRPTAMPKEPRPILIIGGARDAQVAFPDQRAAMGVAIRLNGVDGKMKSCGDGCTLYGGETPAPVMTWIHQGGHEYPRATSGKIAAFFHEH